MLPRDEEAMLTEILTLRSELDDIKSTLSAYDILRAKSKIRPNMREELERVLDELGVENATDLKEASDEHVELLASFLKPVPACTFLRLVQGRR